MRNDLQVGKVALEGGNIFKKMNWCNLGEKQKLQEHELQKSSKKVVNNNNRYIMDRRQLQYMLQICPFKQQMCIIIFPLGAITICVILDVSYISSLTKVL